MLVSFETAMSDVIAGSAHLTITLCLFKLNDAFVREERSPFGGKSLKVSVILWQGSFSQKVILHHSALPFDPPFIANVRTLLKYESKKGCSKSLPLVYSFHYCRAPKNDIVPLGKNTYCTWEIPRRLNYR